MSDRTYPALNAKQVTKVLRKAGFLFIRQSGSHAIYEKNEGQTSHIVVVPTHSGKSLKPGTIKSIISQSGMSKREFYSYITLINMIWSAVTRMFLWMK